MRKMCAVGILAAAMGAGAGAVPVADTAAAPVATIAATVPAAQAAPTMKFVFNDATVDTVLNEMSSRLGFVIVKPQPIQGRISIMVPTPVDADRAIELLNSFLVPMGYAAIERKSIDGTQRRELRILPWEKAKKEAPVGE